MRTAMVPSPDGSGDLVYDVPADVVRVVVRKVTPRVTEGEVSAVQVHIPPSAQVGKWSIVVLNGVMYVWPPENTIPSLGARATIDIVVPRGHHIAVYVSQQR